MRGVSRYFDTPRFVRALTDVSFEVRRGEVFGLLGPSGSGKSTTIRILAGRLSPSEGKARVFGRSPRRHSARMRVGYLPQRPSHNKSHLLAQAVGFLRDLFIWRKQAPALRGWLTFMPGNERQLGPEAIASPRTRICCCWTNRSLRWTPAGCAEMRDVIVALARRGKTVILTSDSFTHAKDICDRFAVYYAGQIEALGTLDEILATTDAIRITGPVLPQETAQRVLEALREGLGLPGSAAEPPIPKPQSGSPTAAPATLPEPATVATPTDAVLAPLVGSPRKAASNEVREQIASPVSNDRLTALTKAAPTGAPNSTPNS